MDGLVVTSVDRGIVGEADTLAVSLKSEQLRQLWQAGSASLSNNAGNIQYTSWGEPRESCLAWHNLWRHTWDPSHIKDYTSLFQRIHLSLFQPKLSHRAPSITMRSGRSRKASSSMDYVSHGGCMCLVFARWSIKDVCRLFQKVEKMAYLLIVSVEVFPQDNSWNSGSCVSRWMHR